MGNHRQTFHPRQILYMSLAKGTTNRGRCWPLHSSIRRPNEFPPSCLCIRRFPARSTSTNHTLPREEALCMYEFYCLCRVSALVLGPHLEHASVIMEMPCTGEAARFSRHTARPFQPASVLRFPGPYTPSRFRVYQYEHHAIPPLTPPIRICTYLTEAPSLKQGCWDMFLPIKASHALERSLHCVPSTPSQGVGLTIRYRWGMYGVCMPVMLQTAKGNEKRSGGSGCYSGRISRRSTQCQQMPPRIL